MNFVLQLLSFNCSLEILDEPSKHVVSHGDVNERHVFVVPRGERQEQLTFSGLIDFDSGGVRIPSLTEFTTLQSLINIRETTSSTSWSRFTFLSSNAIRRF